LDGGGDRSLEAAAAAGDARSLSLADLFAVHARQSLTGEKVMRTKTAAAVTLLALVLIVPNQKLLACETGAPGKYCASSGTGVKGWIELHRADGEIVRINTAQIVFVMSATNTGADKRARSKIQLLNGSIDVLESVDEVSQALKTNDSV
jgi:hypothetical protein